MRRFDSEDLPTLGLARRIHAAAIQWAAIQWAAIQKAAIHEAAMQEAATAFQKSVNPPWLDSIASSWGRAN